jgi:hypothetical protein
LASSARHINGQNDFNTYTATILYIRTIDVIVAQNGLFLAVLLKSQSAHAHTESLNPVQMNPEWEDGSGHYSPEEAIEN